MLFVDDNINLNVDETTLPEESQPIDDINTSPTRVPNRIFIVPYRNRIHHKFFFCRQMDFLLEGEDDYEIYFVHQDDSRPFNRGATKNIGFLAMKEKYPNDYKNISFIFNDVDSVPFHKLFSYHTVEGIIKHHYGFETSLGGIVVITGADFERVNGYPNFWGWGMEDTCLQKRCIHYNIQIDRSEFHPIGSPEILQLFDGVARLVSSRDPQRMNTDNGLDGISTINKLQYSIDESSSHADDNVYTVENLNMFVINVRTFMTLVRFEVDKYHEYDLREPVRNIPFSDKPKTNVLVNTPESWKNIPTYPNIPQQYARTGNQVQQQPSQYRNIQNPQQQRQPQPQQQQQQQEYMRQFQTRPVNRPQARASAGFNISLGGVR
jgi:hypothetical protein